MEFTDKGREAFARVTKRLADRGRDCETLAGVSPDCPNVPQGSPPEDFFQRFAITLDNQIVSLATIDYQDNPEGIDGRTGASIENIGTIQQAQDLAESLRIGALPINLKLISQTQVSATLGQQALDQGLTAAARRPRAHDPVPAPLLPRARRGGDRGAARLRGAAVRAREADPDHAHAPGHRGNGAHAGGGGRRQHRHVRANKGGGARGADRSRPPSPPGTRRRSGRSSTRTS